MFRVVYSPEAAKQMLHLKKSSTQAYKKLEVIIVELKEHPTTGTGHPEKLRHQKTETWSRRLDKKNRVLYTVDEECKTVYIISSISHYGEK